MELQVGARYVFHAPEESEGDEAIFACRIIRPPDVVNLEAINPDPKKRLNRHDAKVAKDMIFRSLNT